PDDVISVEWELKAKEKRKSYDEEKPHPIEELLVKWGLIEPLIESLMRIEEALAAQDIEPNSFRPGRLFWPDMERLSRRDEIDKIIKRFDEDNVVLMEGYPASGKSSIACRLGYELVKESKWVYYGNLTTRVGLNCQPKELPGRIFEEVKEIKQEVFIIIEDIHHLVKEFDNLNFITDHKHIKLLLTSRPLKQYDVKEYFGHHEGRSLYFQWIVPENKIELKTDKDVVEKILREAESSFKLDHILKTIGEDQPNLLLLSFLIQASKKKGKQADEIKEEIRKLVIDHLDRLKKSTCKTSQDQEAFRKVIGTLSVLSEFEVPMEREFIDGGAVDSLLERLEKKKEILSLKGRIFGQEYYLISHSRLASLYRNVCLDEEERREVLKDYIIQGDFFGTLIGRLVSEAGRLLKSLIKESRKELIKRDLSQASIEEIGNFLEVIAQNYAVHKEYTDSGHLVRYEYILWADKELAREIVRVHSDILKQKLSQASIREIRAFFRKIAWADKKLAKEIVRLHSDTLKQKDLSQASIREIGLFLGYIAWADKELAREIARANRNTLRQKDISQADIREIGYFLECIAEVDKELAKEIVRLHSDTLKQKDLSQASIREIGLFLGYIAWADKELAKEIVRLHTDTLKLKLYLASIKEIRAFLKKIIWADKELTREIVRVHSDILKQKLSQASIREIKAFFRKIAWADKELAKEIVRMSGKNTKKETV
ncbi:MAG: hypothetical protein DRP81_08700, partial [Candidatus Omnitrophota bacterium]